MIDTFDSAPALARLVAEVALKGTLLMAVAAAVTFALRGATATLRHMLWSFTLVAMLVIPALVVVLPRWQIGLLPSPTAQLPVETGDPILPRMQFDAPVNVPSGSVSAPATALDAGITATSSNGPSLTWSLALIWLGGIAAGLITIIGGLLTLRRIARRAVAVNEPQWDDLKAQVTAQLGISRRVRILLSPTAAMPATWGVFNPVVLLPADANEWDDDRRRVVLLHELAHVSRNDCLTQVIAQLCCAIYWFHPGVWYTARRARSERELACDEQVLGLGVNACDYAAHLLDIARVCRAPSAPAMAVAMARPSQLEGRVRAILEEEVALRWRASRRTRRAVAAVLALATLPLAAMRPWREAVSVASMSAPVSTTLTTLSTSAVQDTFRWKGIVPRGKWVEVLADYSDMRAEPSKNGEVAILAIRKTGNSAAYRIAVDQNSGGVRFCVVKASARSDKPCATRQGGALVNSVDGVRVDFVMTVPAGVGVSAHTGRGNIAADDMNSYVWGTSGQGDISIVTNDLAEASTRIGSISAEFRRRSWKQDLEFLTENGDVTVVAPSDASMYMQLETGLGGIRSEFAGRVAPFGNGQRIMSSVGSGARRGALTLRTGRGRVELKRGPRAVADRSDMSFDYADAPISSVDPKPNPNPDPDYDPDPDPNPDPSYDSNPDIDVRYDPDPNPNPNPEYNPDPNVNPHVEDDPTGERVPVKIPEGLVGRFTDAAMRGWADAAAIVPLRNMAATHVRQHEADLVAERSAWALTLVRNGEIIAPLRNALSNSDWRVRAYAAWALGATRDPRGTNALTAALADSHWRVRMHAASGLQRLGTQRSVDPLIKALSDEYWQVRISAVDALAAIGDRRALPSLRVVAERDPRSMVREEAQSAIRRIN